VGLKVKVFNRGNPVAGAKIDIAWKSNVGGLPIGATSGRTNDEGVAEFTQPFNLFGAYGSGNVSSGLSYGEFSTKLDAFGNAPDVEVSLKTEPGAVLSDKVGEVASASWPFLIAIGVIVVAVAYGIGKIASLLRR
jgi:hypothetical protein